MRIGLVLPDVPAYSETFFRNKILGLQDNGHEIVLYVNNPKAENKYLSCKVIKAPKLRGNVFAIAFSIFLQMSRAVFLHPLKSFRLYQFNKKDNLSLVRNLKQITANQFLLSEKLDWLHFGFGTMALGRENVAKAIGARMAVSFRGYDYYVYPKKHQNCYGILYSKSVRYHVLSEGMKKGLQRNGISEQHITKITPAIDLDFFKPITHKRSEIIHITTVSRLHWIKGLEHTLEALALLKKTGIDFHYTLIGDGIEKERLQFAAYQEGLSGNVTFAGKLVPERVKESLSNTDIYLQYSIQEGFCNAVLEAQATGVLCVVSDAEGLIENVLNGRTGFIVEKQKPILLFEKIKEVIDLSEVKKQFIKEQAVLRVQKEFNLEKQQKEFLDFYTK